MHHFTRDHLFILPHTEDYRQLYGISIDDVLDCLNDPDKHEGLATDHYTVEKTNHDHRIYLYYYLIYPLQAADNKAYAIIAFIGYTSQEDRQVLPHSASHPTGKTKPRYPKQPPS